MGRKVRKQLYVEVEQQEKLRRIAHRSGYTEAKVLRDAIDRFPEDEDAVIERLRAAGILVPPTTNNLLDRSTIAELEKAHDEWLARYGASLGLSAAVIEDRR